MARRFLLLACFLLTTAAGAATLNNDDSCDIAVMPAATLLLPYFEVDLDNAGRSTLFSVTNVTNVDRIARVTLWTDRSYPVFNFNLYLTGYDVQTINLYDVIVNGIIGSTSGTGMNVTPRRRFSDPNPALDLSACAVQPGALDAASIPYMQAALTEGKIDACTDAGGVHELAAGYATIDVVRACTTALPTERRYWTDDIAFDNVLLGEFHQVDAPHQYAQGEPMVHIRAIPEGGGASAGFPRTFYQRYLPSDLPKGWTDASRSRRSSPHAGSTGGRRSSGRLTRSGAKAGPGRERHAGRMRTTVRSSSRRSCGSTKRRMPWPTSRSASSRT